MGIRNQVRLNGSKGRERQKIEKRENKRREILWREREKYENNKTMLTREWEKRLREKGNIDEERGEIDFAEVRERERERERDK